MAKTKTKPTPIVLDLTNPEVRKAIRFLMGADVIGGDGHSIFSVDQMVKEHTELEPIGEYLLQFVHEHKSRPSEGPKSVIFGTGGEVIKKLVGAYSLTIHSGIGNEIGAHWLPAHGRGSEARRIQEAIIKRLDELEANQ